MKKITLGLVACSALLMASPHHAPDFPTELVTMIGNQGLVNDVIDHMNQVDMANKPAGTTGVTGQIVAGGDNVNLFNVSVRHNFNANVGVDFKLPVVMSEGDYGMESWDETGIGDISVAANYHFGTPASEYGTNITTLRYKSTTGDDEKYVGSGEGAFTLSHKIAKDLQNGFSFHGLASYTLNDGEVEDSMLFMVGTSHQCLLSDKAVTNAKFTYFDDGDTTVADIWLEWNSDKVFAGIPVGAGIKIPIIDEYMDYDGTKAVMVYLSTSGFFE